MKNFFKNNWFLCTMILGIVLGCIVGFAWPGATALEPLGTLFTNMMFCVVVPMVFCSVSSAIANMHSIRRAGKVMGTTLLTFVVTAAIAAVIMYIIVLIVPIYTAEPAYAESETGSLDVAGLIVNFFTKPDFPELWSRRAILPLLVAGILFGFGVQMAGGPETMTAKLLSDLNRCLMNVVRLITYYAPIGFFGFFASLVATHGADFVSNYARAIILYYVVAFVYMFVFFPIYAR